MKTLIHPTHGTLTVSETRTPGKRSYSCTLSDGTTTELSSKAINRLLGVTVRKPTVVTTEELIATVRASLTTLDDGPVRTALARDLWAMIDSEFLGT